MPLAEVSMPVRQENPKPFRLSFGVALALGLFAAAVPVRSECVSPSVEAGATTTTVYRCPEGDASAAQGPAIVEPGKTTTVERGSTDIPWFGPTPTKTSDPIAMPKAPAGDKKEDVVKADPDPKTQPQQKAEPEQKAAAPSEAATIDRSQGKGRGPAGYRA